MVTKDNVMASKGSKPSVANSKVSPRQPAKKAKNQTNHAVKNDKKPSSPYSSRGSSPARGPAGSPRVGNNMRKSRSAEDKLTNFGKPPSSRGSDSGGSDMLDQSVRKVIRNTSVPAVEDNINVCVRVRPLSSKEMKSGDDSIVQFPGNGQILLGGQSAPGQKAKLFSYNVVFEPGSTQDDVLQYSGVKRLIEMAVEGFSCTAFCYGQTGSGKTHTLTGPPGLVIDLLNPGSSRKPLAVRWSKKERGFFVENLFTVDCEELDDLLAVLEEGMRNRSVGRHNMNEYSSRSHTILTVHITSEQPIKESGVFISKQGKLNFVDLAGSEMTKKTHSEGKTLEEANNINKSLMVLGYCIASLSESKKKGGHIPYRDSKLTKLLADSLAGNGVTLMIACISPARSNVSETVNTLRYAARAKKIRTKPIVVMDPREALILSLKREVTALQNENDHLRTLMNLGGTPAAPTAVLTPQGEHSLLPTPPRVDLEKLTELSGTELSDLVRHYLTENDALRRENSDLFAMRDVLIRDQELVCRENERLLKKLEDVNSVCCRSPIIPARPTFSAEMLNASMNGDMDLAATGNLWGSSTTGSLTGLNKVTSHDTTMPDSIQKELSKRQIGKSLTNLVERRQNSAENMSTGSGGSAGSASDKQKKQKTSAGKKEADRLESRR